MNNLLKKINRFLYNDFVFSNKYRIWRHLFYWSFHIIIWSVFWVVIGSPASFEHNLFKMFLWIPVFIIFSYPLVYIAIPHLLLKGRVWQFFLLILIWGIAGLYLNIGFLNYIYIPLHEMIGLSYFLPEKGFQPHTYLCMVTSAASPMIIRFFKLWTYKQRAWMQAKKEQVTTELQLLKAQVHPHFLFNTLNNIYSFSLEKSPKTPALILKLSSLLSYMLYECKNEEVLLEKELEIMKNYIDLEKERYGDNIDISVNIEGDVQDKFITPLLILPFLENAFKHGTSEQLERPWMSVNLAVKDHLLQCKVVNSKNEFVALHQNGVGVNNVKKRLEFLYPGKYELKMADEGVFFMVSLLLQLKPNLPATPISTVANQKFEKFTHEIALPANR